MRHRLFVLIAALLAFAAPAFADQKIKLGISCGDGGLRCAHPPYDFSIAVSLRPSGARPCLASSAGGARQPG